MIDQHLWTHAAFSKVALEAARRRMRTRIATGATAISLTRRSTAYCLMPVDRDR